MSSADDLRNANAVTSQQVSSAASRKPSTVRSLEDLRQHNAPLENDVGNVNTKKPSFLNMVAHSIAEIAEEAEVPTSARMMKRDNSGIPRASENHAEVQTAKAAANAVLAENTTFFFEKYAQDRRRLSLVHDPTAAQARTSATNKATVVEKGESPVTAHVVDNIRTIMPMRPPGVIAGARWRFNKFLHEVIFQDVYPENLLTAEAIFNHYLMIRQPPTYKANKYLLFCLSISAVISGEFAGWNGGINEAGYGGYWISNVFAGLMYLGVALCLAELSCAIPATGGAFSYARAVMGNSMGFLGRPTSKC